MSKTVMNKVRNTANKNLRRKIKQRKSKFVKEVVLTAPGPSQKAVRKMQREQRRLVKEVCSNVNANDVNTKALKPSKRDRDDNLSTFRLAFIPS